MRRSFVLAAVTIGLLGLVGLTGTAYAEPSNDDFASATLVAEPLPFTDQISTADATTAAEDPYCAGRGATVWYSYTPTASGRVNANTFGSDYDTTLSVYTGQQAPLHQLWCNHLRPHALHSSVTWEAVAGTTYHLMVGSYSDGPGGNLSLTVKEPLDIGVTVDAVGGVDPTTGVATVSGTVTCSDPLWLDVLGQLHQRTGRQVNSGYFSDFVFCDRETPWTATVEQSGTFTVGPAQVTLEAWGCGVVECGRSYPATADLRLRPTRP